jgi:arylsulfatase A-like enzyme
MSLHATASSVGGRFARVRRRLPLILVILVLAGAAMVAGTSATREATVQGWFADGLRRLVLDAFWRRFDPIAGAALGTLVALLGVLWLLGRWRPAAGSVRPAIAVVALAALVRLGAFAVDWHGPGLPNLVLISIDTLRADRLGAYGYPLPTSPTLDRRLAGEGVVFEQVFSQSPKTTPSHMTMFTSLYPCVHGIELWEGERSGAVLNPRVDTLAEVLRNAGYATAAFTGGAHMNRARGFDQGFQRYRHDNQLGRSREWLQAHAGHSFFLFFHTYEVHDPYQPPPDLAKQFDGDYGDGPILEAVRKIRAGGIDGWDRSHKLFWDAVDRSSPRDVRFVSSLYDAAIRHMNDSTLTSLLDQLDALGLTSNTLVVFTSDHGEAFGEHGTFLHDDLYGGTLHVPLVLRFPGRLPAGARVAGRARLLDLMPTVLDLLGVTPPPDVQGRSLAAAARGAPGPDPVDAAISEYDSRPSGGALESVRQGSDVLIRNNDRLELFDLATDPGEQNDRATADPARAAALRSSLESWRATCRELASRFGPRAADRKAPDAQTLRQLRALGYVE